MVAHSANILGHKRARMRDVDFKKYRTFVNFNNFIYFQFKCVY